jgi:uncharacterized protein YjbI with pentapeptide repeats
MAALRQSGRRSWQDRDKADRIVEAALFGRRRFDRLFCDHKPPGEALLTYYLADSVAEGAGPGGKIMATKKALELLRKGEIEEFNRLVRRRRKDGKSSVDLDDQNLGGLDLRKADLRQAHLNGANLRKADLRGARLKNARLRQADLRGADLREADLTGADLRRAECKDANFKKAVLDGVRGLG